jgi:arylsulfatase
VNDIAPTIYEAAGIEFPSMVDGIEQVPLDGTSLVYTFDQPDAPSRHRIQVFEQVGNRAIYKDGWIAAARHIKPWVTCPDTSYEADTWELYRIDDDFSEARDLANKFPDQLAELKALFESQARENNIYPLGAGVCGRRQTIGADPVLPPRTSYVFGPDLPLMHSLAGPNFTQPHRISVEVDLPENPAGVLLSVGTRFAGFALYLRSNRLIFEWHSLGNLATLSSDTRVPAGSAKLEYTFTGKTGQLHINGLDAHQRFGCQSTDEHSGIANHGGTFERWKGYRFSSRKRKHRSIHVQWNDQADRGHYELIRVRRGTQYTCSAIILGTLTRPFTTDDSTTICRFFVSHPTGADRLNCAK